MNEIENFPDKKYNIIYADPPWQYQTKSKWKPKTGGMVGKPDHYYNTMSIEEISKLPVKSISADNCVLFIWAIHSLLDKCINVIKLWGFTYSTLVFIWIKDNPVGLGNYTRYGSEVCLLGRKGSLQRINKNVRQVHYAPITKHSAKPNLFRNQIVKLYGDLPRIELFARQKIFGWDVYGDQIPQLEPLESFI